MNMTMHGSNLVLFLIWKYKSWRYNSHFTRGNIFQGQRFIVIKIQQNNEKQTKDQSKQETINAHFIHVSYIIYIHVYYRFPVLITSYMHIKVWNH